MIRFYGLAVFTLLVCGCNRGVQNEPAESNVHASDSTSQPADTVRYSIADFQALRYLEGDWRGSGYEGGPFYETYQFVNDSTIGMTAWTDSTMTTAREQSQYMLRDGGIRTSKGARLTGVDDEGHHFRSSSYGWTFRRLTADRWEARVGPATTYTMDRIARP